MSNSTLSESSSHLGETARSQAREYIKQTKILSQAIKKGNLRDVRDALDKGALPEMVTYPNKRGTPLDSALGKALKHKNRELIEVLIKAGAPLESPTNKSLNQLAMEAHFSEVMDLFKGLTPSTEDILFALKKNDLQALKIMDGFKFTPRDKELNNLKFPMIFFARSPEMVEYLVKTGTVLDFIDNTRPHVSWTAIDWMIESGESYNPKVNLSIQILGHHIPVEEVTIGIKNPTTTIEKMIELGAKVTKISLFLACRKGHPDLIRLIVNHLPDKVWGISMMKEEDELKKSNPDLLSQLIQEQRAMDEKKAFHSSLPNTTNSIKKSKI